MPRANSKGALAGLMVGGSVSIALLVMEFTGGLDFYRELYSADTTLFWRSAINFLVTMLTCLLVSRFTADESDRPGRPEISFKLSPGVKKQFIIMSAGCFALWGLWIYLFG